jgi:hypothetical protein
MKIMLTTERERRWRADVMNVDFHRDHVRKILSSRSTGRTRRLTMVCIAGGGILRIVCEEEEHEVR